jgi:hypothetical protein
MVSGGAPDWRVWLIDSPGSQLRPRAWASRKRLLTAGVAHRAADCGERRHGPAAVRGLGFQPGCACLQDRLRSPAPRRRRRMRSLGGRRPSHVRGRVGDPTGAVGALRGVRRPLARQSTGRPKGSLPPGAGPNQGGRGSNGPPEKLWRWGEERVSFGGRPPKRGGKRAARNCRSQPSALTHVSAGLAAASFSSPNVTLLEIFPKMRAPLAQESVNILLRSREGTKTCGISPGKGLGWVGMGRVSIDARS